MNFPIAKILILALLFLGAVLNVTSETVIRREPALLLTNNEQRTTSDEIRRDVPATGSNTGNHFRDGVAAYEAGLYEVSAAAFRVSLAQKISAETLLNLGLAEWRGGRNGAAILAWEQSAWLDPFLPGTRNNLLYAREITAINPPELTWCEEASLWLPSNSWAWIAGGSLWLAAAMMTLPAVFRWRKAGWHQTLAALAWGIFLLSLPPNFGVLTRADIGIVMEKNTALRLTPTQTAETVASLAAGEAVRQLRARGNYFFVHTQSGDGWISRQQIKFICPR